VTSETPASMDWILNKNDTINEKEKLLTCKLDSNLRKKPVKFDVFRTV
jgi:hypothetical protein